MTNYRPVPLTEHAVFESTVYRKLPGVKIMEQRGRCGQKQAVAGCSSLMDRGQGHGRWSEAGCSWL